MFVQAHALVLALFRHIIMNSFDLFGQYNIVFVNQLHQLHERKKAIDYTKYVALGIATSNTTFKRFKRNYVKRIIFNFVSKA